jgi:hypothetical protein
LNLRQSAKSVDQLLRDSSLASLFHSNMRRQKDEPEELCDRGDQMDEDGREKWPEPVPHCEVDELEDQGRCGEIADFLWRARGKGRDILDNRKSGVRYIAKRPNS